MLNQGSKDCHQDPQQGDHSTDDADGVIACEEARGQPAP
jgi:hypothetical protein